MKRLLYICALILSFSLSFTAIHLSRELPANKRQLVEKKYAGWNGVLHGWVCSRWRCDGSFIHWLNSCAASFEKDHPGVYLEFTSVSEQNTNAALSGSALSPDLIFFSPGTINDPAFLESMKSHPDSAFPSGKAIPVCMGAYMLITCDDSPPSSSLPFHLPDEPGRSFSHAAAGLIRKDAPVLPSSPELDLGLPAASSAEKPAKLDNFIHGEIPSLVLSQLELSELQRLRDAGRCPDWHCVLSGDFMYADQLLLGGIPSRSGENADERISLSNAFLLFLQTDPCRQKLQDIGAFPVAGEPIYPPASVYADMERLLRSLPLKIPEIF